MSAVRFATSGRLVQTGPFALYRKLDKPYNHDEGLASLARYVGELCDATDIRIPMALEGGVARQDSRRAGEPAHVSGPADAALAGGEHALELFLNRLPPETGTAFAVVRHFAPACDSTLARRLGMRPGNLTGGPRHGAEAR